VTKGVSLHLKRFHVEERTRRLMALDQMKNDLEDNLLQLEGAAARERQRGADSMIARLAMPRILEGLELRRQNIEKTRIELERDRGRLEAELAAATEELKTAEFAESERRRRSAQTAAAVADFREHEQFARRHLRRHAMR
jgi:hypothetical protein